MQPSTQIEKPLGTKQSLDSVYAFQRATEAKAVTDSGKAPSVLGEIQVAINALYHARNLTNQPHFYAKLTMAIQSAEACLVVKNDQQI